MILGTTAEPPFSPVHTARFPPAPIPRLERGIMACTTVIHGIHTPYDYDERI